MHTGKYRLTLLPLAAATLFGISQARAADTDARFELRIGAMNADGNGTLSGSTSLLGQPVGFSEKRDFGSAEISPRVDGVFRLSDRNRLIFDYFQYDKKRTAELGQDLDFDDYTIPTGSHARAKAKFQLASLIYDFSVVDTPNFSAGLELGAEWAKIRGSLFAEADGHTYDTSESDSGVAPVVGLRFTGKPGEHWLVNVQGQYLDANWGNFDYSGKIKRANAIVEYRFTRNFGVFAGYDWFKVNYEESGRDGTGGIDLEFKGPVAGVTLAF